MVGMNSVSWARGTPLGAVFGDGSRGWAARWLAMTAPVARGWPQGKPLRSRWRGAGIIEHERSWTAIYRETALRLPLWSSVFHSGQGSSSPFSTLVLDHRSYYWTSSRLIMPLGQMPSNHWVIDGSTPHRCICLSH